MSSSTPQSVVVIESHPFQPLQTPGQESAYHPDYDVERALPLAGANMDTHGVRHRGHGMTNADGSPESSPNSSPALTPSSSTTDHVAENAEEASHMRLRVYKAWQTLIQMIPSPFTRSTIEVNSTTENGNDKWKPKSVDAYPEGLPQLAAFMASDRSFFHIRTFKRLFLRILLHDIIDLTEIERRIDEQDVVDSTDPIMKFRLHGPDGYYNCDDKQRKLMDEARIRLSKYADLAENYARLSAHSKSSRRDHRQLFNWMINEGPLSVGKGDYIYQVDDFVSPGKPSDKDQWIEDALEALLDHKSLSCVRTLFQTGIERDRIDGQHVRHYNDGRFVIARNVLVVLLTVGLTAIPVLLLFLRHLSHQLMSSIAMAFVVVFAISVASITGARPHDVMVGTAAYSALVIMFLGNILQSPGGQ